jgi:hypothetical protein
MNLTPLVLNKNLGTIEELNIGDNLDLDGSSLIDVVDITMSGTLAAGTLTSQSIQVSNLSITDTATFSDVANIRIPGGHDLELLTTDGNGNLYWSAISGMGGSNELTGQDTTVKIESDGNVTMSINGVSNVAIFTTEGPTLDGNVTATKFIGDGSLLTKVKAVKVDAPIGNITITGGNVGEALFTDGTGNLSWVAISADKISNGTSNVAVSTDANIDFTVSGNVIANVSNIGITTTGLTADAIIANAATLGDVANLTITGGSNAQYLQTDGNGTLVWANVDIPPQDFTKLYNGDSNVKIDTANADVVFAVNGTANTAVFGNVTTTFNTDVVITGNIDVQGNITYIESNTVNINDTNIVLANTATTEAQANGGGITINGADATMMYISSSNSWSFSHPLIASVFTGVHRGASQDLVVNKSGGALAIGDAVYISGAQGQRIAVAKASNSSETTSAGTIGIIAVGGDNNSECYVQYHGVLAGVSTTGLTEGDPIFLGATAGTWTTTQPIAPAHMVVLGFVQRVNGSSGEIYIDVNNFQELDECSDVLLPDSANIGDAAVLAYDSANSVWVNYTLDAGTY